MPILGRSARRPGAADASVGSEDRRALTAFTAVLVVLAAWLRYLTRGATFDYDEWSFIADRRGHGLDALFVPHNEHVSTVPILIFKVLLQVVGLGHYWPYQLLAIGVHLGIAMLVYLLARDRLGAWPAVVPGVLVAALGAAYEDILWPFQIGYMIPVGTMLAALLVLRRRRPAADLVACGLLIVGTFCSSLGVLLALAVGIGLAVERHRWTRIVLVAGPSLVLYAAWTSRWGTAQVKVENAPGAPKLMLDLLSLNLSALTATPDRYGALLAVAALAVVVVHVVTGRALSGVMIAAAAGIVLVWAAQATFRPNFVPSRYFHPGGVLLVVLAVELAAARRLPRFSSRSLAVAGGALAIVLVGQADAYRGGGQFFRTWGRFTNSSLAALQIAGTRAAPSFRADPVRIPQLTTAKFDSVSQAFGSPAIGIAQLQALPEDARENADSVLVQALQIQPTASPRPARRSVLSAAGPPAGAWISTNRRGCAVIAPDLGGGSASFRLQPQGVWIQSSGAAEVRLRRFGSTFPPGDAPPGQAFFTGYISPPDRAPPPVPLFQLSAGAGATLAPGRDGAAAVAWIAQVSVTTPTEVCALPV